MESVHSLGQCKKIRNGSREPLLAVGLSLSLCEKSLPPSKACRNFTKIESRAPPAGPTQLYENSCFFFYFDSSTTTTTSTMTTKTNTATTLTSYYCSYSNCNSATVVVLHKVNPLARRSLPNLTACQASLPNCVAVKDLNSWVSLS